MTQLSTSVIIPTKGRVSEVCRCISSILKQTLLPQEIIIVDSSKKADLDLCLKKNFRTFYSKIKYIHFVACLAAARNIGVKHSSGDIVFFFDDDVILDKNYIKEVVSVFMNDKKGKIGGVMGRITNAKKKSSYRVMLRRLFFLNHPGDGKCLPSGHATWVHNKNKIMRTDFLSGCLQAYRKKIFNEFEFDEELGKLGGYCYWEDADFSFRVSRKYVLMYTPFAKLEHYPPDELRINSMSLKKQLVFNHFYLFKKNMPKHFLNVFAFCLSIFGLLLLTLLRRTPKETIGVLQGIIHATLNLQ